MRKEVLRCYKVIVRILGTDGANEDDIDTIIR